MKKTLLSMMGVAVTVLALGQSSNINGYSRAIKKDIVTTRTVASAPTYSAVNRSANSAEALGAVLFSETFSAGLAGDGSNGTWSTNGNVSGATDPDAVWEYRGTSTTPTAGTGSQGAYAGSDGLAGGAPIASPTTANGFFIFDSDYRDNDGIPGNFGNGSAPTPHESWLVSPTFSTLGSMDVSIDFTTYFRRFAGNGYVLLSNDGGLTWGDSVVIFDADFGVNEASTIDMVINTAVNYISNTANAKIAVYFDGISSDPSANGLGYYFVMIDDIVVSETPDNNLSLDGFFYRTNGDTGVSEYYSRIPEYLAGFESVQFSGTTTNLGSTDAVNAVYTTDVITPTGTSAFSSAMVNIVSGASDSLVATTDFSFTNGQGVYAWVPSISSDSTDDVPSNNMGDTMFVSVTDTIFSRDRGVSGNFTYGAGNTYELGWIYDIYDTVKATSITIAVGDDTPAGEPVSVYIYDLATDLSTSLAKSEFNILDTNDIGVLITFAIPETILNPGSYIVSFKCYSDAVTFPSSDFDPSTAVVSVNDDGFGLTNGGPVVRLNITTDLCDVAATATQTGNNTAGVTATGGTAPYTYLWDNGETTAIATNLSSGITTPVTHSVTITDASNPACTFVTTADIVSGVQNIELNNNVTLFPNPNNGEFTLALSGLNGTYTISVRNVLGQIISTENVNVSGSLNKTISNTNLEKGIYFVEISDNNGANTVVRFIVE